MGSYDTDERGRFWVTHTLSRYITLGPSLMTISFTDLADDRVGWYKPAEVSWMVVVFAGTTIEASPEIEEENATLNILLRDDRGSPLVGQIIKVSTTRGFVTLLTDRQGNTSFVIEEEDMGAVVFISYDGDGSRYLLPSNTTYSPLEEAAQGTNWIFLLAPFILLLLAAALILTVVLRIRRMKGDRSKDRIEEAVRVALYDYRPGDRTTEAIIEAYRNVLHAFEEGGMKRDPSLTPGEFLEILEEAAGRDGLADLKELTRIFQEARYSNHYLGPRYITTAANLGKRTLGGIHAFRDIDLKAARARIRSAKGPARPTPARIRVDPMEDLRELLGKKGGRA